MNRHCLTFILAVLVGIAPLCGQNILREVLSSVEFNNTTLKTLRSATDAEKLANRAEISLPDPEIGYNHLWGSPKELGVRQDLNVSQSLDLATISGMKSRLAEVRDGKAEWHYRANRMAVLLEAEHCVLDIIYCNAALRELGRRQVLAGTVVSSLKQKLDRGDGSLLEYNNSRLNLAEMTAEVKRVESERASALVHLTALNGGIPLPVSADTFDPAFVPENFDVWYASIEAVNPILAISKSDVEISRRQLSLDKAETLPSLSLGYMSEKTVGERLQGISVSVSIPLWSNAAKVKKSKAALLAAQGGSEDSALRFRAREEALYQHVLGLREVAVTYREVLDEADNTPLLDKALQAGEISVLEYLVESEHFYESFDDALIAERDFRKALAELYAVEL